MPHSIEISWTVAFVHGRSRPTFSADRVVAAAETFFRVAGLTGDALPDALRGVRRFLLGLGFVGLVLAGFGWWGVFTVAGQAIYPEMAGMTPFFSGIAGLAFLLIAGVGLAVLRRRRNP